MRAVHKNWSNRRTQDKLLRAVPPPSAILTVVGRKVIVEAVEDAVNE